MVKVSTGKFPKFRRSPRSAMSKRLMFRTSTDDEIIGDMEFVALHLRMAATDAYQWKYVIHGAQQLLQTMMMCWMSNTIQSNIRRHSAEYAKWVDSLFNEKPLPAPRDFVHDFGTFYKALKGIKPGSKARSRVEAAENELLEISNGEFFLPTEEQDKDIADLIGYRNKLEHYDGTMFVCYATNFIHICKSAHAVVIHIFNNPGNLIVCPGNRPRLRRAHDKFISALKHIEKVHARDFKKMSKKRKVQTDAPQEQAAAAS